MSFARDLNSVLQIKLKQIFPITFHDEYSDKVVLHRYNEKDGPVNQNREKTYKYKVTSTKFCEHFILKLLPVTRKMIQAQMRVLKVATITTIYRSTLFCPMFPFYTP